MKILFGLILSVSIWMLSSAGSWAATILVTDRSAFAGDDLIGWGAAGAPFTVLGGSFAIQSQSGDVTADVSELVGELERRDQGLGGGWSGNFGTGAALLWTGLGPLVGSTRQTPGPIVIDFDVPVIGAGAQIQRAAFGSFTATLDVFDSSNNLLASFDLPGTSNSNADDSAIFLGVRSDSSNIDRIEYRVSGDVSGEGFSINQLDLALGTEVPVTAPPPLLVLFVATVGMVWAKRNKAGAFDQR